MMQMMKSATVENFFEVAGLEIVKNSQTKKPSEYHGVFFYDDDHVYIHIYI